MSAARRRREQDMRLENAWQTALALDENLDRLMVRTETSESTTGPAQPLLETAQFLSALNSAQLDSAFAAALRQSLMNSAATPPPASSSPLAATLGIQPALPPMYSGHFRPTPRLAAMLVAVLCVVGALFGGDNLANRAMDVVDQDPTPSQVNDIPIFRNDPAGAAAQPGPAPTGPVSIHRTFRTGANLTGSPVIADGVLYVGAFNQRLYAIDAANGTERWSFDAGGTVRGPAVVDDVVYIVAGANDLIAVDAASGTERWRVELNAGYVRPPTVVGGTVYLSSGIMASNYPAVADDTVYTSGGPSDSDGGPGSSILYAFDADTGQERWRVSTGDHLAFYAIDTATGQVRWRQPVDWSTGGAPAVSNGIVVVDAGYNGPVIAMDAGSGQEIWRYNGSTGQGPVIVDGVLYSTNFALDHETGRELWRNDAIRPVVAAPAIVGDTAYLMTEQGTLYALHAKSGAGRWHSVVGLQIAYALSPIVTGDIIYVAASDGTVYALGDNSNEPGPAALPRDVPSPDDCSTTPVDPASVVVPPPTMPQFFVWPLGSPVETAIATEVSAAYREVISCQNTGDSGRFFPLYSSYYWQQSASRGELVPTANLFATDAPIPPDQTTAIRSLTDINLLNDGRIGAVAITEDRSGPTPKLVTRYIIFARSGDRWLIDDAVTIWESSEIPPISLPASNSATGAQSGVATGPATPSINTTSASNYPVGSTALSRLNTVVLRSIPRTIGEHIARLPGPRSLTVTGAIVDSGDDLWLPVTDVETGVFGYLSVNDVLPPAQHTLLSHLVGETVTSDAPIYLRARPETSSPAGEPLPAGTAIRVIGDTISQGLTWLRVEDPRSGTERWVLPDVLTLGEPGIGSASPAPATSASPHATPSDVVTVPIPVNLRDGATFAARALEVAAPSSVLIPIGPPVLTDGVMWIRVEGHSEGYPRFLPAVYLTAAGALIPGTPVLTDTGIGIPSPSECQVEPMPLADIASYMGPAGEVGQRSAMTYLATGVAFNEIESFGASDRSAIERAVMATVREAIACQNAGGLTQSVALYTQDYYQRAGAESFRPVGSESWLATPQPLPSENRTEILEIGDLALIDDGRVGVIVITAARTELTQVTAAYVILAETGNRWLIDDAITIDASVSPGGYVIPAMPHEPTSAPTPATVSAEARTVVEDYLAIPTSTPTATTPTEPSPQAIAQPSPGDR